LYRDIEAGGFGVERLLMEKERPVAEKERPVAEAERPVTQHRIQRRCSQAGHCGNSFTVLGINKATNNLK
jgi:hypothetical protein